MTITYCLSGVDTQPLPVYVFEDELKRLCPDLQQLGALPQCGEAPYLEPLNTVYERPRREIKQSMHADGTPLYRAPASF